MANKRNNYTLEQQQEFINKANEMYKNGASKKAVIKELNISAYALDEAVKNLNYKYIQKPFKGYAPIEPIQEPQKPKEAIQEHKQEPINNITVKPFEDLQEAIKNRTEFNIIVNTNELKATSIRLYKDTLSQLEQIYKLHPEKKNQDILNTIILTGIKELLK